jgi:leishmanolysin
MHALGFAANVMEKYWPIKGSLKNFSGQNWVVASKVVEYAKTYFNCPSLTRVPFEDERGPGSAGSHWERTTFGNEAMTAADYPGPVFSRFTLLLFESSGWYYPDYTMA